MAPRKNDPAPPRGVAARPPSEQLAAILRARAISPYELGRMAGVDPSAIGKFLRGRKDLTLGTVDRLAAALGLDLVERSRSRARPAARGPVEGGGPAPGSDSARPRAESGGFPDTASYDPDSMDRPGGGARDVEG